MREKSLWKIPVKLYGIIYPPQVALVGFGKVVERPWSVDGQVLSRPTLTATLSADHRVSDGHRSGLFLSAIDPTASGTGQVYDEARYRSNGAPNPWQYRS
jgi:hypothetical protein